MTFLLPVLISLGSSISCCESDDCKHIYILYTQGATHPAIRSLRVLIPGTMWINMEKRAFRLNGNAKNTKVGDLHIETCHGSSSDRSDVVFLFYLLWQGHDVLTGG